MKRIPRLFSSRRLTPFLILPGVIGYGFYLASSGDQAVMLSTGFEVLQGGVDVSAFVRSAFGAPYVVIVVLHLFARIVASWSDSRKEPDLYGFDAESIVADADAYSVVVPGVAWLESAESALPGMYFRDVEGRAVFWRRPQAWTGQLWKIGLLSMFAAMLLSMFVRQAGVLRVGDGEIVESPVGVMAGYDWRWPDETDVHLPVDAIGVNLGTVDPGIDENLTPRPAGALSSAVTAEVAVAGSDFDPVMRRVGMWPPSLIRGDLVSVVRVGVAPHLVVRGTEGLVFDGYDKLDIMPGDANAAEIRLEGFPYHIRLTLDSEPPFLMREATYFAEIVDAEGALVASGTVGVTERSLDASGFALDIPESNWWVGIAWVHDPALWVLLGGMVLLIIGVGARILAAARGRITYSLVVEDTSHGRRLYIGMDSSPFARRRERVRFAAVVRTLEGGGRSDE